MKYTVNIGFVGNLSDGTKVRAVAGDVIDIAASGHDWEKAGFITRVSPPAKKAKPSKKPTKGSD